MFKQLPLLFLLIFIFSSCEDESELTISNSPSNQDLDNEGISGIDISSFPEIEESGIQFKDHSGKLMPFLDIIKENGVNTIRLRVWVDPESNRSDLDEVKEFSLRLKAKGFKIWLALHYSDTWADPAKQLIPNAWKGKNLLELKEILSEYTSEVSRLIQPEYVQIGNEINSGFLHPLGHIDNLANFKDLLQAGIQSVRATSENTKVILHYAGYEGADRFFEQLNDLDYDIIGLSYYPIWHGKSLDQLESNMSSLIQRFEKDVVIAETAYPFTLEWNDYTHNIVGLDEQLILPQYPASPEGQSFFVQELKSKVVSNRNVIGFCYWGPELVSWKGPTAEDASPWENQALFDFDNQALPALEEFNFD